MENILLLGNGFDLSIHLPTRYADFIKVVACLCKSSMVKKSQRLISDILKEAGISSEDCTYAGNAAIGTDEIESISKGLTENLWFKFFVKRVDGGETWIDFEQQIAWINHLMGRALKRDDGIVWSKDVNKKDSEIEFLTELFDDIFFERQYFPNLKSSSAGMSYVCVRNDYMEEWPAGTECRIVNRQKIVDELVSNLDVLARSLKLYLKYFIDDPVKMNKKELAKRNVFLGQSAWEVLTLNYTNTYELLTSDCGKINVKHIHGNVKENIVLGYNDDADDECPVDTTFLRFKKYYQRSFFGTSQEIVKINNMFLPDKGKVPVNLLVVGCSLDRSDADIVQTLFELATKINVYCHDENAKRNCLHNVVRIYGKSGFERLVNDRQLSFIVGEDSLRHVFSEEQSVEDLL